ncbi:MAG TPA: Hpt domain-containing protein [Verrucomicrobiales bacterium]|nr:Hpt domain-containing protein [Verrucomicrobiales bacterium]HIL72046.1 Hpt domain-containing protein [Verrucomicrobiota bacterium]
MSLVVFDREAFLERLMGDEELANSVKDGFLEDIPSQTKILLEALEAGDASTTEGQAHKIKGAAATVGGLALSQVAQQIETSAQAGDLQTARTHMVDLETRFELLREAMETQVPCF